MMTFYVSTLHFLLTDAAKLLLRLERQKSRSMTMELDSLNRRLQQNSGSKTNYHFFHIVEFSSHTYFSTMLRSYINSLKVNSKGQIN